jgi:hypothetical protein
MTALEALFLRGEPELTHRLAQRVSVFVKLLGASASGQSIYEEIAKGYKIRSAFIHGGSLKSKDRPTADSLAPLLLDYTRRCILAFFQISTSKEDLLQQLDRVMIEPGGMEEVGASLAGVVYR